MTTNPEPVEEQLDVEGDEPEAEESDELPDAAEVDDRPDWVPPRIPDFEEGPHGDQ